MTRSLRVLALGLFAAFALSAMAVSMASAEHFTAEQAHTTLLGSKVGAGKFEFEGNEGGVDCNTVTFEGTTSNATITEITVHPAFETCLAFGFPATVTTTGCDFLFTIGSGSPATTGSTHIECTGANIITVHFTFLGSACTLTFHAQTPTEPMVTYTTGGSGANHDLLMELSMTGITYARDGAASACSSPVRVTTRPTALMSQSKDSTQATTR